jgi:heme exporter protein D|tara:strand:+ start:208 stop:441 length:234 start_codon:yes stop_codon:yes gene_type:complete
MINDIIYMSGYGMYVWSAFSFTLLSFAALYTIIKTQMVKEELKFKLKFKNLTSEKVNSSKDQKIYREILTNSSISNI